MSIIIITIADLIELDVACRAVANEINANRCSNGESSLFRTRSIATSKDSPVPARNKASKNTLL